MPIICHIVPVSRAYPPPPPEKGPKRGKTVQISKKALKIDTFSGGGERNFMDCEVVYFLAYLEGTLPLRSGHLLTTTTLSIVVYVLLLCCEFYLEIILDVYYHDGHICGSRQDRNILPELKKGVGIASIPIPPQQHYLTTTHHTLLVSSV